MSTTTTLGAKGKANLRLFKSKFENIMPLTFPAKNMALNDKLTNVSQH
jgi:hypothetical protein